MMFRGIRERLGLGGGAHQHQQPHQHQHNLRRIFPHHFPHGGQEQEQQQKFGEDDGVDEQQQQQHAKPTLKDLEEEFKEEEEERPPVASSSIRKTRSVIDFATADELRQAMLSCQMEEGSLCCGSNNDDTTAWLFTKNEKILQDLLYTKTEEETIAAENEDFDYENLVDEVLGGMEGGKDWVLEHYDVPTSKPQTVNSELLRLLVLKSFMALESTHADNTSFDEITKLAKETFDTSYCMISLVDLGRQWFLSKQGLDATETPRNISFCTHGIQSTLDVFEVPDASQDERFKTNPLVTGSPYVQYYAGAPLLSPEGYKLGMLCVCDTKPRPPLALEQREILKGMAALTVHTLVEHRQKMRCWFNNLVSTHFPDLDLDKSTTHHQRVDDIDDEEQDEDDIDEEKFLAFLEAMGNLPLEVVGDILLKEQQEKTKDPLEHHQQIQQQKRSGSLLRVDSSSRPKKRQVQKHLRFADKVVVYNVESYKDIDELWISPDEMMDIRDEKREQVSRYKDRFDYRRAILKVVDIPKQQDVKDHFPELINAKVPNARGLETSIVDFIRQHRKTTRRAVVHEQWYGENSDESLRDTSLQHSQKSTQFAANLAQVDSIVALFDESDNPTNQLHRILHRTMTPPAA